MGTRDTLPRALAGTHEMTKSELRASLTAALQRAEALEAALHGIARSAEMCAEVMRDPLRTGGWSGARRVADSYQRFHDRAKAALTSDGIALAAAIEAVLDPDRHASPTALEALRRAWRPGQETET